MQCQQHTYVIQLDISKALTKQDFEIIYNVLFARRYTGESLSIRRLLNNLALSTRLKRTFTDNEDPTDDSNEQVILFFKFDHVELPRFKSDLISIYEEKVDREFKLLNRSKYLYLIGVPTIRLLQPSEQAYLLHQIENYVYKKKSLGEIELLCNKN
jgi:hypothetical protein